jgi:hypothetical protein
MSEKAFWRTLGRQMKVNGGWRQATRHEDKLQRGIADVSFVNNIGLHGWIELKKLAQWPARESTLVTIKHYHDEQKIFLKDKGEAGGNAWLLIKIDRDVLLFDWDAAQEVGNLTKAEMFEVAAGYWLGKTDYRELGATLCGK